MRATGRVSEERGSTESGAFKPFQQDKARGHNRGGILGEAFQVAILASAPKIGRTARHEP